MSHQDQINRAEEAKRWLSSPLYKEAWTQYQSVLLRLLSADDISDKRAAELRSYLVAIDKVRLHWERIVKDGLIAAEQIRMEETRKRPLASRLFR